MKKSYNKVVFIFIKKAVGGGGIMDMSNIITMFLNMVNTIYVMLTYYKK